MFGYFGIRFLISSFVFLFPRLQQSLRMATGGRWVAVTKRFKTAAAEWEATRINADRRKKEKLDSLLSNIARYAAYDCDDECRIDIERGRFYIPIVNPGVCQTIADNYDAVKLAIKEDTNGKYELNAWTEPHPCPLFMLTNMSTPGELLVQDQAPAIAPDEAT